MNLQGDQCRGLVRPYGRSREDRPGQLLKMWPEIELTTTPGAGIEEDAGMEDTAGADSRDDFGIISGQWFLKTKVS